MEAARSLTEHARSFMGAPRSLTETLPGSRGIRTMWRIWADLRSRGNSQYETLQLSDQDSVDAQDVRRLEHGGKIWQEGEQTNESG